MDWMVVWAMVTFLLVVATAAMGLLLLTTTRERQRVLEREWELQQRLWAVQDQLTHHLATMRRAGYETQPEDGAWETHTISEAAEAEIEAERQRIWNAGSN
jgi:hypothetical protein